MKKITIYIFIVFLFGISINVMPQGVAINSDGSAADGTAILDVKSTTKGILIPRMTYDERNAITSPAAGLLVYQTNNYSGFYFYNGTIWFLFDDDGTTVSDFDNNTKIQVEKSTNEDIIRFDINGTEKMRLRESILEFVNTGYSVFIGEEAGTNDDLSDNYNVFIGYQAGKSNTSGERNTGIGNEALKNITNGIYNSAIGENAGPIISNTNNSGAFGYLSRPLLSNYICIGNTSITGIGGYASWSLLSDKRFNQNIEENIPGLEFIKKLRPVTYNLDVEKLNDFLGVSKHIRNNEIMQKASQEKAAIIQTGFIAQEVEQTAQSLGYNFSGVDAPKNETGHYGLRYAEFVVPLVKAIQEQQKMIEELKARIEELEKK
ncbi:MAG: tail fiber domain-containing protein [Bacteroidetes bacterium]|nr:tail fiber domain-containing protein [Bacteroidota bacterium]